MADRKDREKMLARADAMERVGVIVPENEAEELLCRLAYVDAQCQQPDPESWQRLIATLTIALYRRQKGKFAPNLPSGLDAGAAYLNALASFFLEQPWLKEKGFQQPLAELLLGIMDIAQGNSPDLFKPIVKRTRDRPLPPQIDSIIKGQAAQALDLLVEAGDKAEQAARRVLRTLKSANVRGSSKWTAATIQNWRYSHRQGEGASGVTEVSYSHFLNRPPGDSCQEQAEYILRQLKQSPILKEIRFNPPT